MPDTFPCFCESVPTPSTSVVAQTGLPSLPGFSLSSPRLPLTPGISEEEGARRRESGGAWVMFGQSFRFTMTRKLGPASLGLSTCRGGGAGSGRATLRAHRGRARCMPQRQTLCPGCGQHMGAASVVSSLALSFLASQRQLVKCLLVSVPPASSTSALARDPPASWGAGHG